MKRLAVLTGIDIDISELLFRLEMIEYYEDEIEFRAIEFKNLRRINKDFLCFMATLKYSSETDKNEYEITTIQDSKDQSKINIIIESMREEKCIGDEYIIDSSSKSSNQVPNINSYKFQIIKITFQKDQSKSYIKCK